MSNEKITCQKRVALVILNWNGADMMRRFLPSVVRNTPEADIIVADNGSTDGSPDMLAREFPEVRCLPFSRNYGFAEGYDKAFECIDAEFYLLLNSDVEVPSGWLRPLLAHMDAHPGDAACQPKLLAQRNKAFFEYAGAAGGYIDRYGYPFCRGRVFSTVERDEGQYDAPAACLWATGAALLVRAADWHATGGLDARFFAHMEEIDFCWRLRCRGRGVACVPQSVAYHVGGATLGAEDPRKTFLNFRNNLLMLYKNLPASELKPVMRRRALLDGVAATQMLLTGRFRHARAVLRARRAYHHLKPQFRPQREENLAKTVCAYPAERLPRSLVALYYLRRKHTFSTIAPFFKVKN